MAVRTIAAEEFEPEQTQGSATPPELTPPPMLTPIAKRTIKASEFEPEKPLSAQTATFQQPEVPAPSTAATPATPDVTRYESSMPFHELEGRRLNLIERPKKELEAEFEKRKVVNYPVDAMHEMAAGLRKEFPDLDERTIQALVTKTTGLLATTQSRPIWGRDIKAQFPKDAEGNATEDDRMYIPDRDKFGSTVKIHALAEDPTHLAPVPNSNFATGWGIALRSKQNPNVILGWVEAAPPSPYATTVRENMIQVPQPDGSIKLVPVQSVTSREIPGKGTSPTAGIIAPTAAPVAIQGAPQTSGVITEDLIKYIQAQNKANNLSRETVIEALKNSGYQTEGGLAMGTTTAPTATAPTTPHAEVKGEGTVVGGKSLTPEQRSTEEQKGQALGNTMDLMDRMYKNLPVLSNLVNAGKIQFASDPASGLKTIISRALPLTPQEEQMAADMISLSEHINVLRGPLGATGFRGPEAFVALQAQRTELLARPEISRNLMLNTMRALVGQKVAHDRTLARPNKPELDRTTANLYFLINGKDARAAEAAARKDGYDIK